MHGELWICSRETHSRSFNAQFIHGDHQGTDEFVATLKTKKLILPIRFVEEHNIESDRMTLVYFSKLGEDVVLILALFTANEFQ